MPSMVATFAKASEAIERRESLLRNVVLRSGVFRDHTNEFLTVNRFCCIVIATGVETRIAVGTHGVGGEGNNRASYPGGVCLSRRNRRGRASACPSR